ncbi:hypothetical protein H2204_009841 [Knufia peltigerae]|uniref:Uncharacterized protein n=1 Tax=Knufia peltigerae TaxID=1002370 RepID=A0AA38XXB5_9EURO|nr:hypothetical protein H2204_009841 [Knufia peltigerae]
MTAARLSPAASLLRNSKLFALPPALSVPPTEPTSEPVVSSDSATTPYPLRAALETPRSTLFKGDWGLKRALPVSTTTKSGTPTVRILRGIDTPEHVADFESAADHVLTLRKYQELNLRVTLPATRDKRHYERTSAFDPEIDHTAEVPLTLDRKSGPVSWLDKSSAERVSELPKHLRETLEKVSKDNSESTSTTSTSTASESSLSPAALSRRRWRYLGPYLAGLNGAEFEAFLGKITKEKRAEFRKHVERYLISQRIAQRRADALESGETGAADDTSVTVSEEDVAEYLRQLRSEPSKFAPLIVEFFDLADGPKTSVMNREPWHYGRDTIAADQYKESGPPRTHPSAGLSYLRSESFAQNDVIVGPRDTRPPVPARLLKTIQLGQQRSIPNVGMAGFVIPQPHWSELRDRPWQWQSVKDGPKLVVQPVSAAVSQGGKVEINTRLMKDWHLENDVPVEATERRRTGTNTTRPAPASQVRPLDRLFKRQSTVARSTPAPSQDISEELNELTRRATQNLANKPA